MLPELLKSSAAVATLIVFGAYKIEYLRVSVPKTLMMSFNHILKFTIASIFAKNRLYFNFDIFIVAIFCSFHRFLHLLSFQHLSILLMSVLSPLKLIFVVIILRLVYGEKLNCLQNISILCILTGNFILQYKKEDLNRSNELIYIICSVLSGFFGALTVIYFDRKIRLKGIKFWNYMFTYSFLAFILAIFGLMIEKIFTKYTFLDHMKNYKFYMNTIVQVGESLLNTFLVFKMAPLTKILVNNFINVTVTLLSNYFYKENLTKSALFAVFLTYLGTFIYEYDKILKKRKRDA